MKIIILKPGILLVFIKYFILVLFFLKTMFKSRYYYILDTGGLYVVLVRFG